MAKISELPELAEPTGTETVVVLDGSAAKRVPLADLAAAAVAPSVARLDGAILSIGDQLADADFTIVTNSGSVARGDRGLTFPLGAGSGTGSEVRAQIARADSMRDGETFTFPLEASTSGNFTRDVAPVFYAVTAGGAVIRDVVSRVYAHVGRVVLEVDYQVAAEDTAFIMVLATGFVAEGPTEEWLELDTLKPRLASNDATIQVVLDGKLQDFAPAVSLGGSLDQQSPSLGTANGALASGRWGVSFPSGTTGQNTNFFVGCAIDAAAHAGRDVTLRIAVKKTSASFTRALTAGFQVQLDPAESPIGRAAKVKREEDGEEAIFSLTYRVQGDEAKLLPYITQNSAAATTADERFEIVDFSISYGNSLRPGLSNTDEMIAERIGAAILQVPALRVGRVIEVDEYASLPAAIAMVERPSPGFITEIRMGRGVYALTQQLNLPSFVRLIGKGRDTIVRLFQLDSVSGAAIIANSVINFNETAETLDFDIEGQNVQYGIHKDTTGQKFNTRRVMRNVHVRHYGNPSPNNSWSAPNAVGAGYSGGDTSEVTDCHFWAAAGAAYSLHNNPNARAGCEIVMERNVFATDVDDGFALIVNAINSGHADRLILNDNVFGGRWAAGTQGWTGTTRDNMFEWTITGSGNTPAVFGNGDASPFGTLQRPMFADEELQAVNGTGATIPFKTVLAFDGSRYKVRPMTAADSPALLAGVAWEAIPSGRAGRVKHRGHAPTADILRSDAGAFAYGDTFSIDPITPGQIVLGGSQGVFEAVGSGAIKLG